MSGNNKWQGNYPCRMADQIDNWKCFLTFNGSYVTVGMRKNIAHEDIHMRYKLANLSIFNQGNRLKRSLSIKKVSSGENGMNMYSIANDLIQSGKYKLAPNSKPYEPNIEYQNASMQQFHSQLKPNTFYILVEKAIADSTVVTDGGHITSFITDKNGSPNKDFTVSLRPGEVVKKKVGDQEESIMLSFTYQHHNAASTRSLERRVRYVKFVCLEFELKKIFDQARSNVNSERLYLIELPLNTIPTSLDEHIEQTEHLIKALTGKWFILLDGSVNRSEYKALNCVTGFYARHLLRTTTKNPSPQMAAWSYLSHVYGDIPRDKFIHNTKLKDTRIVERHFDDKLEKMHKEELTSLQRN